MINEIRIGNFVIWRNNDQVFPIEIEHFQMQQFWEHIRCADIVGIPLTSEILEKCGFVKGEIQSGFTRMLVREYRTEMQGVFPGQYCIMLYASVPYTLYRRFKYLHELQNLFFAITGEELKINL